MMCSLKVSTPPSGKVSANTAYRTRWKTWRTSPSMQSHYSQSRWNLLSKEHLQNQKFYKALHQKAMQKPQFHFVSKHVFQFMTDSQQVTKDIFPNAARNEIVEGTISTFELWLNLVHFIAPVIPSFWRVCCDTAHLTLECFCLMKTKSCNRPLFITEICRSYLMNSN